MSTYSTFKKYRCPFVHLFGTPNPIFQGLAQGLKIDVSICYQEGIDTNYKYSRTSVIRSPLDREHILNKAWLRMTQILNKSTLSVLDVEQYCRYCIGTPPTYLDRTFIIDLGYYTRCNLSVIVG